MLGYGEDIKLISSFNYIYKNQEIENLNDKDFVSLTYAEHNMNQPM